jgi:glycosyltransferase involved in cell wall biosynthesis
LKRISKVVFVLATRFPTEKAYGTTTEFTAQAVRNSGLEVVVATPKKDNSIPSGLTVNALGGPLSVRIFDYVVSKSRKGFFELFVFLYSLRVMLTFRNNGVCFWTRDIVAAYVLSSIGKYRVVCEIHRTPYGLKMVLLRRLAKRRNVTLGPIGDFLDQEIPHSQNKMIKLPMAVNSADLVKVNHIHSREKIITYLGSASSSGNKVSFKVLNDLAEWLKNNHREWKLELIGISETEFYSEIKGEKSSNMRLFGRLPREDALRKLRNSACGLVIYPEGSYFRDSFPIKIVEYAASGVAIVASDTHAHRKILEESRASFFNLSSAESLFEAIESLILDDEFRLKIATHAREWVSAMSYESRVRPVLDQLQL